MRVRRDFDRIYERETDPWNIGNADSERYTIYHRMISENVRQHRNVLDIGCGFGAFLARFQGSFDELVGVELSAKAIEKARQRFPSIRFVQGSAEHLEHLPLEKQFDVIIFADVVYYLDEHGKRRALDWIARHLSDDGIAFLAAWSPGGQYLEPDEFYRLVQKDFVLKQRLFLESKHAAFVGRRKRRFIAITVDYETWHPIPPGKAIDWDKDVFIPANELLKICDEEATKITWMAEMGEYFWLAENRPAVASKMEAQWKETVRKGHDVQLHLHPCWLPETGARYEHGEWKWDWSKSKAEDYPGDLRQLISKCKTRLETLLRPEDPQYSVESFRAGAYQAQPFKRLSDALTANGILCDTSVYAGGHSDERGYDYRFACSDHQPYFANPYDPQLQAVPGERTLLEIPVFTFGPDRRWFLDANEGLRIAERLLRYLRFKDEHITTESFRRRKIMRKILGRPRQDRGAAKPTTSDEYFVMIGHTKADLYFESIKKNLRSLKEDGRFEFVTMREMVRMAKQTLSENGLEDSGGEPWDGSQRRILTSIDEMSEHAIQGIKEMIPLDRTSVLWLGHPESVEETPIAFAWTKVEKSKQEVWGGGTTSNIDYRTRHDPTLPRADASYDCVCACLWFEDTSDLRKSFSEIFRVLQWGGVFVAAIPGYARGSGSSHNSHLWKALPSEVTNRLRDCGASNIAIQEDVSRQVLFIRAWKLKTPHSQLERAQSAMGWVYNALSPERPSKGKDPVKILLGGFAFCWGYALVLYEILKKEGYSVRWITMIANDMPTGRGKLKSDSHEVLEVNTGENIVLLDPMCNSIIPHSLDEVLKNPALAVPKENPDQRYRDRRYDYYDTMFWYSRVVKYKRQRPAHGFFPLWKANAFRPLHEQ